MITAKSLTKLAIITTVFLFALSGPQTAVASSPDNDNFERAMNIDSLPYSDDHDTAGATFESDEPTPSCDYWGSPLKTVWFAFTPATDITLTARSLTNYYWSILAVYRGSSLSDLEEVACGSYSPVLTFKAKANEHYYFQVSGLSGEEGYVHFSLDPAPANDEYTNATKISTLPFSDALDMSSASRNDSTPPVDPTYCDSGYYPKTVWYAFTPAVDMRIAADIRGSSDSTILSVSTLDDDGNGSNAFRYVACGYSHSKAVFDAKAGVTYYMMASSYYYGETLQINVDKAFMIDLKVNQDGPVNTKTGTATVSGSAMCTKPGRFSVWGNLRQKVGRLNTVTGDFYTGEIVCDGNKPSAWKALATPYSGAFAGGFGSVSAGSWGYNNDYTEYDDASATATIKLRGATR